MIWIGNSEPQFIDLHRMYVQAIYNALIDGMKNLLSKDEAEDLYLQCKYHDALHLEYFTPKQFQAAYRILTSSKNELISALIDQLKPMFEIDPRFQAA